MNGTIKTEHIRNENMMSPRASGKKLVINLSLLDYILACEKWQSVKRVNQLVEMD